MSFPGDSIQDASALKQGSSASNYPVDTSNRGNQYSSRASSSNKPILSLNTNVSNSSYGCQYDPNEITPISTPPGFVSGRIWPDERTPEEKFPEYYRALRKIQKSKSLTQAELMDIVGSDIDRLAEDLKNNPPKGLQEARDERKIRALSNKFIRQEVIDYIRLRTASRSTSLNLGDPVGGWGSPRQDGQRDVLAEKLNSTHLDWSNSKSS